ncbi:hypothetical protein B484DRAFT_423281 [Ochromonadaceae sp. CCMP2298]|nr:hypothetical protein B484DRAFT_423281 [Ochromonadaceae sp. CCMP2298]
MQMWMKMKGFELRASTCAGWLRRSGAGSWELLLEASGVRCSAEIENWRRLKGSPEWTEKARADTKQRELESWRSAVWEMRRRRCGEGASE